jgi:hypothetical protein
MQRQFPARPITSPKIGRSMVEPTKEDNLDRPKHNRRAGRADPDCRRRGHHRRVAVPDRRPGRWFARCPADVDDGSGFRAGVRIFAVGRGASHVRPTPARAESRDATARSRAGSRSRAGRWRPAQADGGRSDGARPSLRAGAASPRRSTRTRRSSAARRVFVTVDAPNQVVIQRSPAGGYGTANALRPRSGAALGASLARPQTLPISVRGTAFPL